MSLNKIYYIFRSMRPKQWTKNSFVFAGLIFSKAFFDIGSVLRTVYAFFLFSFVSGSVYIINDIIDREKDRLHPQKAKRPIASGKLDPKTGLAAGLAALSVALLLALIVDQELFFILAAYFILVLLYSVKLKHLVILDVILISLGFVLRTIGGAVVIDVRISPWLIACTTFLALFLALNKRKNELIVLSSNATGHRENLKEYTPELIDQMLSVVTPVTVMSYALYTFNAGKSYYMMLTIPFVLYGIFRYQYLASSKDMGGSPEIALLKDKPLLINILLWILSSLIIVMCFY
jgi:4-hydroxybenzoate polyprenyltransferase